MVGRHLMGPLSQQVHKLKQKSYYRLNVSLTELIC